MSIPAQGAVGAETMTAGQVAREGFYDGRHELRWEQLSEASVEDWERAAAAAIEHAALASPRADSAELTADDAPWPEQYASLADGYGPVEEWRDWTKQAGRDPLSPGALHVLRGMVGEFATPAPATPPGVPDRLRAMSEAMRPVLEERDRWSDVRFNYGDHREVWLKLGAVKKLCASYEALLASQPAGQAGDAGVDALKIARIIDPDAFNWPLGNAQARLQAFEKAEEIVAALPAPNCTRTGAAETGDKLVRLLAAVSDRLRDNPPNGLVEGDLYVAAKNEGPDSGWRYVPTGLTVGDLDEARALIAARPVAPSDAGWRERVRHVKRGTEYEVLGEAEAQVSGSDSRITESRDWLTDAIILEDGDNLTVYRGTDGRLWCRPTEEFRDGRFETITPPSDPAPSGQADG